MIRIPGTIPITIHPIFWVLCFLIGFYYTTSPVLMLIWAFVVFISVLVHEFGHALTGLFFNQKVQIDLVAMGGLTSRQGPPLKLWQEFLVVFFGPLAGFMLAGLSVFLFSVFMPTDLAAYTLIVLFRVNVFWTILNLLPVQPLDGGQLLRIILEGLFGVGGIRAASFISMLVAAVIAVLALIAMELLIGAIMLLFAFESYRRWSELKTMTVQDQNQDLQNLFHEAEAELQQGHFEAAEEKLSRVRFESKQGMLYGSATLLLAQLFSRKQEYKQAYELLKPVYKNLGEEALPFFHQLSWKVGDYQTAALLSNETYQVSPTYQTALINALSYSQLGQAESAVGWLKRAISDGLPNLPEALANKEFDSIRLHPLFPK